MTHPREDIRKKIVAILIAENTSAGARVYPSRILSEAEDLLPCINVYTNTEDVEIAQESPREYGRALKVVVDVRAKADNALDDVLDALALEVEHALMQDHTLGDIASGAVNDVVLQSVEISISDEGKCPIGSCIMTYVVTYFTRAVADFTSASGVEDLKIITAKMDQPGYPEGPDGEVDIESRVTFSEET